MAVLGRWAWLIGGSGGDLTIDAYKLDLAPCCVKSSRPEASADLPSGSLRAASAKLLILAGLLHSALCST